MTQEKGEVFVDGSDLVMEVRVTHAAGLHGDECLTGPGIRYEDGGDLDRLAFGS